METTVGALHSPFWKNLITQGSVRESMRKAMSLQHKRCIMNPTQPFVSDCLPKIKTLIVSSSQKNDWQVQKCPNLVVLIDEDHIANKKIVHTALQTIETALQGAITEWIEATDFEGKWLQLSTFLCPNKSIASTITLVGCGKKKTEPAARARQLGIRVSEELAAGKFSSIKVTGTTDFLATEELCNQFSLGLHLGNYKYPSRNPSAEQKTQLETPVEVSLVPIGSQRANVEKVNALATSINMCRLLQDGPPNIVFPKSVAESAVGMSKGIENLTTEVFGATKLRQLGFECMLAVGGGSSHEPQLVVSEYKPKTYSKTIVFVGKGLTMDTGGYCIKGSPNQFGMKYDMSGSAVVLSAIQAIAKQKLPVRVISIGALCENMIDAHAYRVGDILKGLSGKTIEIIDTDAEGRIVLSDALYYAATEYKPNYLVEYSTLTGAMVVSLGKAAAGIFPFHHDKLGSWYKQASDNVGEKTWILPTFEEYSEDVKGTLADLNNVQNTKGSAGSPTSACFLKEFVNEVPYLHIDIAGVADGAISMGLPKKISSAFGVQGAFEFARMIASGEASE
jgi:leucyl aminopeptidase